MLRGEVRPADAVERVDLAQVAEEKGLHAMAARLFAEAFTANPSMAEDLEAGYRYNAACSAVLAGCGKGKDQPPPDESARIQLRDKLSTGSRRIWPLGHASWRTAHRIEARRPGAALSSTSNTGNTTPTWLVSAIAPREGTQPGRSGKLASVLGRCGPGPHPINNRYRLIDKPEFEVSPAPRPAPTWTWLLALPVRSG